MALIKQQTPYGTWEVLEDGARIGTGTESWAENVVANRVPLPPKEEPKERLSFSTQQGANIVAEDVAKIDEFNKTVTENKAKLEERKKIEEEKKAEQEKTVIDRENELRAIGQGIATGLGTNEQGVKGEWLTNPYTGKNDFFPAGKPISFEKPEVDLKNEQLDKEGENLKKQLSEIQISQDAVTNAYIDAINRKYATLIEQQKEINRRSFARVQTAQLREGRARYVPEITSGILSTEESANLAKINVLESQKMSLIADANQARIDKNYRIVDKKIEEYEIRRREQKELIKKQAELQAEKEKEQQKKIEEEKKLIRKLDNEKKIKEMFDQGITDRTSIAVTLGIPLKDVDEAMKIISPDETLVGLTADLKTFKYFFPEVNVQTKEGRQKYLDWQAQVVEADRKTREPTQTEIIRELEISAFKKARPVLEQSRGEDGYVDPNVYMRLRTDYAEVIGNPSDFDLTFASLLSPQERIRLGIGKATRLKAEEDEDNIY